MSFQESLKRSGKSTASRVLSSSAHSATRIPGGERSLARTIALLSRKFVPRAELLIRGESARRRRPPGEKVANVLIDSAPEGALALVEAVDKRGYINADMLERVAARCDDNGELETAVELRRRAAQLDPETAHRHSALAHSITQIYKHAKRQGVGDPARHLLSEAVESVRAALKLAPGNAYLMAQLGHLLVETGVIQEGIELLEASTTKNPTGATLRVLGEAYRAPGIDEYGKAFRSFERSLARDPKNDKARAGPGGDWAGSY